jgi:DNA-binding transcriptional LysR family regulator
VTDRFSNLAARRVSGNVRFPKSENATDACTRLSSAAWVRGRATGEVLVDRMSNIVTFVKIAEVGGFAAAARKLGVSPSTVTTQIQDLEHYLGERLLNRSTRKVNLTEIGKAYYERCTQILADMEEAEDAVRAMHLRPRGSLHLNVSISIPFLLAPVIAEFTSLYPSVRLSVTMTDRMIDLVEEGIDLAITTHPVRSSNLIIRRVGSFRLLVCGSPDYIARRGMPQGQTISAATIA